MNTKSPQYIYAEKAGNLLAEKNVKIEQQARRIVELEDFIRKFADNFAPCRFCDGKGSFTRNGTECGRCYGTGKQIDSLGILFVELPQEASELLDKVQS